MLSVRCGGLKIPFSSCVLRVAARERRWWRQIGRERKLRTNLSLKQGSHLWNTNPFCERQNYEGSQCMNWTTGGDKEDEVLVTPLCQQLAAKMPRKLRHTWWSKRHRSARQKWAGHCHCPPHCLQRTWFGARKRWKTTNFSLVAGLKGWLCVT